uniref:Uncharacterized protein n=1 Tax=Triticum urartu TaxID=4572 RepID=A0A8R7TST8_TRIUA
MCNFLIGHASVEYFFSQEYLINWQPQDL